MSSKLSDILKLFAWGATGSSKGPSRRASPSKQTALKPKVIKLNFRDICEIDVVDALYHDIQELSLNHNHLDSLEGIQ